ncbi:hypothetical protein BaRGS_00037760 [Batillaria attramentaria]|uniref:Uncharacterized protein n=1 Tax=Batillaria attramentaria TaxID=370345 RepID=A0ABD0J7Q8_9CAEN
MENGARSTDSTEWILAHCGIHGKWSSQHRQHCVEPSLLWDPRKMELVAQTALSGSQPTEGSTENETADWQRKEGQDIQATCPNLGVHH